MEHATRAIENNERHPTLLVVLHLLKMRGGWWLCWHNNNTQGPGERETRKLAAPFGCRQVTTATEAVTIIVGDEQSGREARRQKSAGGGNTNVRQLDWARAVVHERKCRRKGEVKEGGGRASD